MGRITPLSTRKASEYVDYPWGHCSMLHKSSQWLGTDGDINALNDQVNRHERAHTKRRTIGSTAQLGLPATCLIHMHSCPRGLGLGLKFGMLGACRETRYIGLAKRPLQIPPAGLRQPARLHGNCAARLRRNRVRQHRVRGASAFGNMFTAFPDGELPPTACTTCVTDAIECLSP